MDPTIPSAVLQELRQVAEAEWPDDFEQQVYYVDSQAEAWLDLALIEQQAPADPLIQRLLGELRDEWPLNYELQLFHLRAQLEARDELVQLETLYADVPADVFATICRRALRTAPDDLDLLRSGIAHQVEAWRALNARFRPSAE